MFLNGLKRLNEDELKETGAMDDVTDIERYYTKMVLGTKSDFDVIDVLFLEKSNHCIIKTYSVETYSITDKVQDSETLYNQLEDLLTNQDEYQGTYYILESDEDVRRFLEIKEVKDIDYFFENQKLTYAVEIHKHDKDVTITVSYDDVEFFEYTIKPSYLKDVDYLVDMILDERLDNVFVSEDVSDSYGGLQDYLTIADVKSKIKAFTK